MKNSLYTSLFLAGLTASGSALATTWQIDIAGYGVARGQAPNPADSIYHFPLKQYITLDNQGNYRDERFRTFPGKITFHFLEVGSENGAKTVDIDGWRTGTETDLADAQSAKESYADLILFAPALLDTLAVSKTPIDSEGKQTLVDQANRTWQIQRSENGDIIEIKNDKLSYQYHNWQGENSLRHPKKLQLFRGDNLVRDYSDVNVRAIEDGKVSFDVPAGYETSLVRDGLRIVQVADQLYRLEGSPSTYHMAFAVGSNGIVLFDTPRNKAEGQLMRQQIELAFPDKKVTDIVYSHGHSDHQLGLSAWLDLNPTIWTGENGRLAVQRNVPDVNLDSIVEVKAERNLTVGNLTFRLIPHNSDHATDMLVALFPAAKAVLQGDLFMVPNQGPVAAYAMAEQLQTLLTNAKFNAEHIISVHGRVATSDDLALSVKHLKTSKMLASSSMQKKD